MGYVLIAIQQFAEVLRSSKADRQLGPPTLSVGRIEGGTSVNTVPDRCRIEVDRRILPGEEPLAAHADFVAFLRGEDDIDFPFEGVAPWLGKTALGPLRSDELIERPGESSD